MTCVVQRGACARATIAPNSAMGRRPRRLLQPIEEPSFTRSGENLQDHARRIATATLPSFVSRLGLRAIETHTLAAAEAVASEEVP